jgi:hypothetical protein
MAQDRKPDWRKWRHVPLVKIWEAVALSLDIEPKKVDLDIGWESQSLIFDESDEFNDRIFVAGRQVGTSSAFDVKIRISDDPPNCSVDLSQFAAWALSIDWDVPPEFRAMAPSGDEEATEILSARSSSTATKNKEAAGLATSPLGTRECGTLLKLVLGMALGGYAYDPKASRSTVPREIVDDLQKHGISISDDTVRHWLTTAATEVEWQPRRE